MTTTPAFADARPFSCRVVVDDLTRSIFVIGSVEGRELGFAITPDSYFDVGKSLIDLRDQLYETDQTTAKD